MERRMWCRILGRLDNDLFTIQFILFRSEVRSTERIASVAP